jgi:WD40 repeat protein
MASDAVSNPLLYRLCRSDANQTQADTSTAFVVNAVWFGPANPSWLAILYSNGTIRLWNSLDTSYVELCLHIPASGLPAADLDSQQLGISNNIESRRVALPITHMQLIPGTSDGADSAGFSAATVVLTVKRSLAVYVANLEPDLDMRPGYINGVRVYELETRLSGEATSLTAWLMSGGATHSSAVVAGTADGNMHAWVVSRSLNPSTIGEL